MTHSLSYCYVYSSKYIIVSDIRVGESYYTWTIYVKKDNVQLGGNFICPHKDLAFQWYLGNVENADVTR